MISRENEIIKSISFGFDENFIKRLSLLLKKEIEPIIKYIDNEPVIIGFKCPVRMSEKTFDKDKESIESDILKTFADVLSSELCNKEQKDELNKRENNNHLRIWIKDKITILHELAPPEFTVEDIFELKLFGDKLNDYVKLHDYVKQTIHNLYKKGYLEKTGEQGRAFVYRLSKKAYDILQIEFPNKEIGITSEDFSRYNS